MQRQGFGVVEVLLIVAVLVVLWTVLWPIFRPANHGEARRTACMANHRQLAVAMLMNAVDNTKCLPLPSDWNTAIDLPEILFDCPITTRKGTQPQPEYGMNAWLFATDQNTAAKRGASLEPAEDPSKIELFVDVSGPTSSMPDNPSNPFPGTFTVPAFTGQGSTAALRHGKGTFCSFLDGHVELLKPGQGLGTGTTKYNIPLKPRE